MAAVVRLYFSLDSLKEANDDEIPDIVSFNIYEGVSYSGKFDFKVNKPYEAGKDFIELQDTEVDDISHWFKLAWIGSTDEPAKFATKVSEGITYTASVAGVAGNSIALVFNGTDDVQTVTAAWNIANITNQVRYTGSGIKVSAAGTVTLEDGADAVNKESELSDPILMENIAIMVDGLRAEVNDTAADSAFSDEEVIQKLRFGGAKLGFQNFSDVPEHMIEAVFRLAKAGLCYTLAYDVAKYTKLELPSGFTYDKGAGMERYLRLAKALEKSVEAETNPIEDEDGYGEGFKGKVVQGTMTRISYQTLEKITDPNQESFRREDLRTRFGVNQRYGLP